MSRSRPEDALQKAVVQHLRLCGVPGLLFFAPANEGKRSPRSGARLKAMGMLPGVADLVVMVPGGVPFFLELKSPKGVLSPEQKAFRTVCRAAGCEYSMARSLNAALDILRVWGALKPNKALLRAAA